MGSISGKQHLFFVTSPRSPAKLAGELELLLREFEGDVWNTESQRAFWTALAEYSGFEGTLKGDIALKARDRVNRALRGLGLVNLKPAVGRTPAGDRYLRGSRPHETFVRQLMKYQLPSPYHVDKSGRYGIKPYLELLRLVDELNGLSKDEIAAFVIGMIRVDLYEPVRDSILGFRAATTHARTQGQGEYRRLLKQAHERQITAVYPEQFATGKFTTRESNDTSREAFVATKSGIHRDYADAAVRYLRATNLVTMEGRRSESRIRVSPDRRDDVRFILDVIPREPVTLDEQAYKSYLFDPTTPALLADDRQALVRLLASDTGVPAATLRKLTLEQLKDRRDAAIAERVRGVVENETTVLRSYTKHAEVKQGLTSLAQGKAGDDAPLLMEWNTWRALTMLNDGHVRANLRFDDNGQPLFTAPGRVPDIRCEYSGFDLLVEVTIASGARQYEMEGEPVARHLGQHVRATGRESYCLFVANKLHEATVAHFYVLHRVTVRYYGGRSRIIPITTLDLIGMLQAAVSADVRPTASSIRTFLQHASAAADGAPDEQAWVEQVRMLAAGWTGLSPLPAGVH